MVPLLVVVAFECLGEDYWNKTFFPLLSPLRLHSLDLLPLEMGDGLVQRSKTLNLIGNFMRYFILYFFLEFIKSLSN